MENSGGKRLVSFKLHTFLSRVMKPHTVSLCPAWDMNHPFVRSLHAVHTPIR